MFLCTVSSLPKILMQTPQQHVLVIEDDRALRRALVDQLVRAGFAVDEAVDGDVGLEKITVSRPDLVLLDLAMPKCSGVAMLKEAQRREVSLPPVIVLTNDGSMLALSEVLDRGVTEYIVKTDTTPEQIVATVRERLARV